MEYGTLQPGGQRAMVESRIGQVEVEHYQHTLNLTVAQGWDDANEAKAQVIAESTKAIAQAEAAHKVLHEHLAALPASPAAEPEPLAPVERQTALTAVPPIES